jgi:hypothetical protein
MAHLCRWFALPLPLLEAYLDEIVPALKSESLPSDTTLMEGLARADELAPLVYAVADKLCHGIYLLAADNEFLFYGLHILAAEYASVKM